MEDDSRCQVGLPCCWTTAWTPSLPGLHDHAATVAGQRINMWRAHRRLTHVRSRDAFVYSLTGDDRSARMCASRTVVNDAQFTVTPIKNTAVRLLSALHELYLSAIPLLIARYFLQKGQCTWPYFLCLSCMYVVYCLFVRACACVWRKKLNHFGAYNINDIVKTFHSMEI